MSGCYLLDTHALLWATGHANRLSDVARACMEDSENRILVSHGTIWELSIKLTIGKITLPDAFFTELPKMGYEILPLRDEHFSVYRKLPLLHRDPFDRLLVAQAQFEGIPLLSADAEIARYAVNCLW